jgi:hypothetical protein
MQLLTAMAAQKKEIYSFQAPCTLVVVARGAFPTLAAGFPTFSMMMHQHARRPPPPSIAPAVRVALPAPAMTRVLCIGAAT